MENDPAREKLISELIDLVLNAVNLKHLDRSKITAQTRLTQNPESSETDFSQSLGLDSIDILEVVVVVEHHFGIKIANADDGKMIFKNFGTLADFIQKK
jgi:acyl carrier protein